MSVGDEARAGALASRFDERRHARTGAALAAWYAQHLPHDNGPVLDAAAGSGELLIALVGCGVHMHGAEEDPHAWLACEQRVAALGRAVPLFRQPLAGLNVPFRYAAILLPAGALQRIGDDASVIGALERIRAHLLDPGMLIAGLEIPAIAQHPPGAPIVEVERERLPDGTAITRRAEITVDAEGRRIDRRERYEQRRGVDVVAREDRRSIMTWYTEDQALALVQQSGFHDVCTEALPDDGGTDTHRFAVVARN